MHQVTDQVDQGVIDELVGNAHGNLGRVRELVERHPELVDARAVWDESPIQAAAQMGNRAIIDFLLEHGAPLDFLTACVMGRTEQVRSDLAADSGNATRRGVHELAPLYFAAIGGNFEIAELLLAAGADVNGS